MLATGTFANEDESTDSPATTLTVRDGEMRPRKTIVTLRGQGGPKRHPIEYEP